MTQPRPTAEAAPPRKPGRLRRWWRGLRILILLLILLAVGAGIYLQEVGLPDFIKQPLLAGLRDRGIDLQFSRLRLQWYRGIVAEDVKFGQAEQTSGPQLLSEEIELRLDNSALLRGRLQVESLVLHRGELIWPLPEPDQPEQRLAIGDIETVLRIRTNDVWELEKFQAGFEGATMEVSGTLTNATAVREWQFLRKKKPKETRPAEERLRRVMEIVGQLRFESPPEMHLRITGDARDLNSLDARLYVRAAGAKTPWGTLRYGELTGKVTPPPDTNSSPRVELMLDAQQALTRWGDANQFRLNLGYVTDMTDTNLLDADLLLTATEVKTRWGEAAGAEFNAQWLHSITNPLPRSGSGELIVTNAVTERGRVDRARIAARLLTPAGTPKVSVDESWAWWGPLAPYALEFDAAVTNLQSPKLEAAQVGARGSWRAPALRVEELRAELYEGELSAKADLDVVSRRLSVAVESDFDAQQIAPLLTPKSQRFIRQYSWEQSPEVRAHLSLIMPAWTNRQPDWRGEVRPTIEIAGQFSAGACAFRGIPASSAESHFTYTNMIWRLPDLVLTRPEGRLLLTHEANDLTRDYYFRIHSTVDPKILRPLFDEKQQRAFELVDYAGPPVFEGEVWGRWYAYDRIRGHGTVTATNISLRGQTATSLQTSLEYTNKYLKLIDPVVRRGDRLASASQMDVDFTAEKIYLTNGFSTLDPALITRAIGPKVAETMEPYRFVEPPVGRVNGVIPFRDESLADLHFDIEGGPFEWWRFRVPRVDGKVHWVGENVVITNAQLDFYEGQMTGSALFNFAARKQADFNFDLTMADASLHALMSGLTGTTNRLEGKLSGRLYVTQASSDDPKSWQGGGRVTLRDGLIWDIPIFGIFSPMLNLVWPGLGNSRADQGSAKFRITNSVIHSDDLEIRAPMLRMRYRGNVDFNGNVDARVEAELLRDTWLIGRAVSLVLSPLTKLFEYKVTGTLSEPKSEPTYIPKVFIMPLQPFRTLKELFDIEGEQPPPSEPQFSPPGPP